MGGGRGQVGRARNTEDGCQKSMRTGCNSVHLLRGGGSSGQSRQLREEEHGRRENSGLLKGAFDGCGLAALTGAAKIESCELHHLEAKGCRGGPRSCTAAAPMGAMEKQ